MFAKEEAIKQVLKYIKALEILSNTKANEEHTHIINDITDLSDELTNKVSTSDKESIDIDFSGYFNE